MRYPTGRCSMPCSIRLRARPGCRFITAAASAWVTRSTPAWSSSATAATRRPSAFDACSGTILPRGVMRHADAGYAERHCLRPGTGPEVADDRALLSGQRRDVAGRRALPVGIAADLRAADAHCICRAQDRARDRSGQRSGGQDRRERRCGLRHQYGIRTARADAHSAASSSNCCSGICCCRTPPASAMRCPMPVVRLILALKINALARGHSGVTHGADRCPAGAARA